MKATDEIHLWQWRYTDELGKRMASGETLKPCPACGKQAGELIEETASRFPSSAAIKGKVTSYTSDEFRIPHSIVSKALHALAVESSSHLIII